MAMAKAKGFCFQFYIRMDEDSGDTGGRNHCPSIVRNSFFSIISNAK
jgi:hypothetical protein